MTSWQRMASAPEKPAESFLMPPLQTGEELLSALERLGYAPRPLRRLVSTYTYRDTRDGALRAAGLELRLHAEGARWQLLDRGMVSAQRKAADSTDDVPGAGRLGLRLRALAGGRPLLSQLSAACTETVHLLSGPSSRPMSLSVQEWEFSDLPERNHRVRCRVARIVSSRGARVDIDYLAALLHRHLSLVPTRTGIFETGLGLLEAPLPGAAVPATYRLNRRDTRVTSAAKLLSAQAWAMRVNTAGTRHDRDIEYLHNLRVATRRARFLVRLFHDVLGASRAAALRGELSWIAGMLGVVRDLDVLLQNLPAQLAEVEAPPEAAAEAIRLLRARRGDAFGPMVAALVSGRYRALLMDLAAPLPEPRRAGTEEEAGGARLVDFARRQIRRTSRRLLALGSGITSDPSRAAALAPSTLHRARILFKRLRYTCEFFRPVLGDDMRGALRRLVACQDCLGAHQDAVSALRAFERIARESDPGASPAIYLCLGALMQLQRRIQLQKRVEFAGLWEKFPLLARHMERGGKEPGHARDRVVQSEGRGGKDGGRGQPRGAGRLRRRSVPSVGPGPAGSGDIPPAREGRPAGAGPQDPPEQGGGGRPARGDPGSPS